jgi:hypothetical protein
MGMQIEDVYESMEKEAVKDAKIASWTWGVTYFVVALMFLGVLIGYEVNESYLTPLMIAYSIGAIAHMAGWCVPLILSQLTITSPVNYERLKSEAKIS